METEFKAGDLIKIKKDWETIAKKLGYQKDGTAYCEVRFLFDANKPCFVVGKRLSYTVNYVYINGRQNRLHGDFNVHKNFLEYFDYMDVL